MVASERLQVILEARDEMTAEIRQATKSIKELEAEQRSYAKAAEEGNREAAESYERVRREIIDQKAAQELLRAEQRLVAREARQAATEQARAAMKARQAAREQVQQTQKVAHSIGRLGDKIGLQGREWDKVAAKAVQYKTKWVAALEKVGLKAKETNRDINGGKSGRGGFLAGGWGKAAGAAAVATGAVMGLSTAFYSLSGAVAEARTARKSVSQFAATWESMGRTESPKAIETMISRLSELAGIDDDELRVMTSTLGMFGNVTEDAFTRANELALDLSVKFGKDLQSSAVMVGKAINDPIKGLTSLSRVGVTFTKQQQEQIKAMVATNDLAGAQKIVMDELAKKVGGSAKAQADGIAKTGVAWGNLKEAVGEVLLSSSTGWDLAGKIKEGTVWITKNKAQIVSVIQKVESALLKLASVWLKWVSFLLKGIGYLIGGLARVIDLAALTARGMAALGIISDGTAQSVTDLAGKANSLTDGIGDTSAALDRTSKYLDNLSTDADTASTRTKALADALKQVKSKKVRLSIEMTITDVQAAIDAALSFDPTSVDTPKKKKPKGQRFMGGPVSSGAWMVGEIGPELFVPKSGSPFMVGQGGPEVRDLSPGFVVPNHVLEASGGSTVTRERVIVERGERGPLVENLVVRSEADAMAELQRMRAREVRIARERGA